jgi:hypothetical protein
VTGITDAQRHALIDLGAVDRSTESDPKDLLGIAA